MENVSTPDTRSMTLKEKVAFLKDDLLKRSGANYTTKRTKGRLYTATETRESPKYSPDQKDNLTRAYKDATRLVASMNLPHKVTIDITPDGSRTNGDRISLATNMFDDKNLSDDEKRDIFAGLAVHEGSHVLYSNFKGLAERHANRIIATIDNIIEDERIEMLTGEERPGLADYIAATKRYYFDKCNDKLEEEATNGASDTARLLNGLLTIIRYPSSANDYDLMEFADELIQAREILTPYPKTADETYNAAVAIYNILMTYFQDKNDEDQEDQESQENNNNNNKQSSQDNGSQGDNSQNGSSEQENGKDQSSGSSNKENKSNNDNEDNQGDQSSDNGNRQNGDSENEDSESENDESQSDGSSNTDNDDSDKGGQPSSKPENVKPIGSEEEAEALEDELNNILRDIEDGLTKTKEDGTQVLLKGSQMSRDAADDYSRLANKLMGALEYGSVEGVNIHPATPNKELYEKSLLRVRKYIPAMKSALRSNGEDRCGELRGLRNGRLDTARLAEAVQGVEAVYRRETVSKADAMTVCILIDESGSMDGSKIRAARDTAILLEQAIKDIKNVKLFIYGHTTESGGFVKLTAYHEDGRRYDKYALGGLEAQRSNVDSLAIRECAARVRKYTSDKCLMIVISDGEPCEPCSNVLIATNDLEKDGFTVVSVGIDFSYNTSTMYKNHVSLTDMSKLAPELGKIVKSAILKNTKNR